MKNYIYVTINSASVMIAQLCKAQDCNETHYLHITNVKDEAAAKLIVQAMNKE